MIYRPSYVDKIIKESSTPPRSSIRTSVKTMLILFSPLIFYMEGGLMPSLAYLVLLKWHFPGFAAKVWCKAVRHGKAVGRSGIGRNIILLTAVFRLGVSEVDIVCNDFGTAALAAFLVRPVADLEPALHDGHAAFCEIISEICSCVNSINIHF